MIPLFFYRLDLSKLTFSTPVPPLVGVGIELTAYAPTLAAVLVVLWAPGIRLSNLLRPVLRWRVAPAWYLIALVGPIILFLLGDVIRLAIGAPLPKFWLTIPSATAVVFLIRALIAGSFGEEVGWRGLGQPLLQRRYGALAAVFIGAIWSLWHLWPLVAPGGAVSTTWSDVLLTFLRLIPTSIIYAWLLNSTHGSLLIVMLAHAGHNLADRFFPAASNVQHGDPVVTGLYVIAALAVIAVARPYWLSPVHEFPDLLERRLSTAQATR
jgi:membrane protease YdiL (CAAX protease family)